MQKTKNAVKRFIVYFFTMVMMITVIPATTFANTPNDYAEEALDGVSLQEADEAQEAAPNNRGDALASAENNTEDAVAESETENVLMQEADIKETEAVDSETDNIAAPGLSEEDSSDMSEEDMSADETDEVSEETFASNASREMSEADEPTVTLFAQIYPSLTLDSEERVSINEEYVYYTFTPKQDGYYCLTSFDCGETDPYVTLYEDPDFEEKLKSNNDGGEGYNFSITCKMKANQTYYYELRTYAAEDDASYKIRLNQVEMNEITFHANSNKAFFYDSHDEQVREMTEAYAKEDSVFDHAPKPEASDDHMKFLGWSVDPKAAEPDDEIDVFSVAALYAFWGKQYQVTFHVNNPNAYYSSSKWDEDDDEIIEKKTNTTKWYEEGSTITVRHEEPECDNAKIGLAGWSVNKNAKEPDADITITKDTVLYAVWKNQITVTINANGGYFVSYDDDDTEHRDVIDTVTVLEGTRLSEINWSADNDDPHKDDRYHKRAYSPNGPAIDPDTVLKNGDTLFVVWSDMAAVSFQAADGKIERYGYHEDEAEHEKTVTQYYTIGKQTPINNVQANKEGYAFAGWSTNGKESGIIYTVTPKRDMTLTAVYKKGHNVTLKTTAENQYITGFVNGQFIFAGDTFLVPEGMPISKLALSCGSYNTDNNDESTVFLGFSTSPDEKDMVPEDYSPTEDVTLYPIFGKRIVITFEAGEGSIVFPEKFHHPRDFGWPMISKKLIPGDKIGKVDMPIAPEGYEFIGWENASINKLYTDVSNIVPKKSMNYIARYKRTLKAATIKVSTSNVTYTGKKITKKLSVKYKNLTLEQGKDYTVSYKNNKTPGTATITITGKGNFTGKVSKTFKITKAKQNLRISQTKTQKTIAVKQNTLKKQAVSVKLAKYATVKGVKTTAVYKKTKGDKKIAVNSKTGKITIKKGLKKGSYPVKIKVTAKGNGNYKVASKVVTVVVKVKSGQCSSSFKKENTVEKQNPGAFV